MTLEYDLDVGALYVRLTSQSVARTREFGGNTNVDLDAAGRVVGIEVISAAHRWPLADILVTCDLDPVDAAQLRAYFLPPVEGISVANMPQEVLPQEVLPIVSAKPTPPVAVAA